MDETEKLVSDWRANHDPGLAVAICRALAGKVQSSEPHRRMLVQVGPLFAATHGANVDVLIGLGSLYLAAGAVYPADDTLKKALGLAPNDPRVYRGLGEVFLRAGNARDAERAFSAAVQYGLSDAATTNWLTRARSYIQVQDTRGVDAVKALVGGVVLQGPSVSQMAMQAVAPPAPAPAPAPVAEEESEERTMIHNPALDPSDPDGASTMMYQGEIQNLGGTVMMDAAPPMKKVGPAAGARPAPPPPAPEPSDSEPPPDSERTMLYRGPQITAPAAPRIEAPLTMDPNEIVEEMSLSDVVVPAETGAPKLAQRPKPAAPTRSRADSIPGANDAPKPPAIDVQAALAPAPAPSIVIAQSATAAAAVALQASPPAAAPAPAAAPVAPPVAAPAPAKKSGNTLVFVLVGVFLLAAIGVGAGVWMGWIPIGAG